MCKFIEIEQNHYFIFKVMAVPMEEQTSTYTPLVILRGMMRFKVTPFELLN